VSKYRVAQVAGLSDQQQVVVASVASSSTPVPVELEQYYLCLDGPGRGEHLGQQQC